MSEYENGNREPDLTLLLKYSRLVRVPLETLVDDKLELRFPKNWNTSQGERNSKTRVGR
jgi:transcriptional regulator with XRE-family HTH domain